MTRPAVEVADLLHKQGDRFMDQSPWLNFQQLSVLRQSRAAARRRWEDTSINAPNAVVRPSPIIPAGTGTVRSVRHKPANAGSPRAKTNSSKFPTSTSYSLCLMS
jgi:hypothetical protein